MATQLDRKLSVCRTRRKHTRRNFASKRTRSIFSQEFKQQIVNLYFSWKATCRNQSREYELTAVDLTKWVKLNLKTSGSFKEKDNLTPATKELLGTT